MLIYIEGNIGSGKSTFNSLLKDYLSKFESLELDARVILEPVDEWMETKDSDGRITCLFLILNRDNAKFNAAVPLFTAMQASDLIYFRNSFSNFCTFPMPEPAAQKCLLRVLINSISS